MSFHDPYVVYVKTNSNSYITDVDSSAFLKNATGWEEIDRGYDDRFKYAQSYYFREPIRTDGGAYRYKKMNGKAVECTPEEIREQEEALKPVDPSPTLEARVDTLETDSTEMREALEMLLSGVIE